MAQMPRQRQHANTVMTVNDTRGSRNVVEPGSSPCLKDVLPTFERDLLRRWRPAQATSTVVTVPRQAVAPPAAALEWTLAHI
jgi:hypothetical protein